MGNTTIRTCGGGSRLFWLVVDLPFWKIWKSVGMMTFPIYGEIQIQIMFQTTKQYSSLWPLRWEIACYMKKPITAGLKIIQKQNMHVLGNRGWAPKLILNIPKSLCFGQQRERLEQYLMIHTDVYNYRIYTQYHILCASHTSTYNMYMAGEKNTRIFLLHLACEQVGLKSQRMRRDMLVPRA